MLGQCCASAPQEGIASSICIAVGVSCVGPGCSTAAESFFDCLLVQIPGSEGNRMGGSSEGFRQLVSGNGNTCEVKTSEICKGSTMAALAIGFFSGEICQGVLQSRSLGTVLTLAPWLILVAPSLFLCSYSFLYV